MIVPITYNISERAAELSQIKELRGHIHSYVLTHEHLDGAIKSDDRSRRCKLFAGSLGEAAFEHFLNRHGFDANLNENPHVLEGCDSWCEGQSFDVKTRCGNGACMPHYNMAVKDSQSREDVDYFVFAWIDRAATMVGLTGFCHRDELPVLGRLVRRGEWLDSLRVRCDTWAVPIERLTPVEDLIPMLRDGAPGQGWKQQGAVV
jgi:hypothetical protein